MQNPDNLRVSRAADDLADCVYDFTARFPIDERFGLISQMRRAAVSVGSNIYEGCGRRTNRSLVQFLYYSHASAGELVFQTRLAIRRKYGDAKLAKELTRQLNAIRRMLSQLIRYHEARRSRERWERRERREPYEGNEGDAGNEGGEGNERP